MQTPTNTTKIIIGVIVLILIGVAIYMSSSSDGMLNTDQVATTTASSTRAVQGTDSSSGTGGNSNSVSNGSMTAKPGQVMTVTPKKNPLAGTSWIWNDTSFNNKSASTLPSNKKFVITFGTDGAMTSSTDCNSVSGRYVVNNDKITITSTASTKMACGAGSLESVYIEQLTQITNFTFESLNELDLTTVNGSATMSFTRR